MAGKKLINIIPVESIVRVAELAVHIYGSLFLQYAVTLVFANGFKGNKSSVFGTTALKCHGFGIEESHRFFIKQAVQKSFAIKFQQFIGLNRACKVVNPLPEFVIFLGGTWHTLEHQAGSALLIGKQKQTGGDLLRALEIFFQASPQTIPLPRHHALVAAALPGCDGNGHTPVAQQIVEAVFGHRVLVESCKPANLAVVAAFRHECSKRAFALGLNGQCAFEVQAAAHNNAGYKSFSQKASDRLGIRRLAGDFTEAIVKLYPDSAYLAVFKYKTLELVAGCHIGSPENWVL